MWFEEYMCVSSIGHVEMLDRLLVYVVISLVMITKDELDVWAMFVTQEMTHIQMGKSEIDLYLGEPNHLRNEDLDILDYWFKTLARYPTLALMARDLLTIPVSAVASESAFSIGGKTITTTRSSLKPKTVQALICLRDWMPAMEEGIIFVFNDSSINRVNIYSLMYSLTICHCSFFNSLIIYIQWRRQRG